MASGWILARNPPEKILPFILSTIYLLLYNYNLNILLMALHEHPTLHYQPTSTSIRLVLPSLILYHCNLHVQLLCTRYSDYPAVTSEQRIPIILLLYDRRSTRGTRKYSKVYPVYQTHLVGYDE